MNANEKQLSVFKPNATKLSNLNSIKEMRKRLLNEFYKEMQTTADRLKISEQAKSIPIKEFKLLASKRVELVAIEGDKRDMSKQNGISKDQNMQKTPSKIPRLNRNMNKTLVIVNKDEINLTELKERIIKRKFGYLWLRKAFGQILPSEAE